MWALIVHLHAGSEKANNKGFVEINNKTTSLKSYNNFWVQMKHPKFDVLIVNSLFRSTLTNDICDIFKFLMKDIV